MFIQLIEWNCYYMYKVYIFCLYVDNVYMYGCILFYFNVDCEFRVNFNLKEKKLFFCLLEI